jgi:hypothetical protein
VTEPSVRAIESVRQRLALAVRVDDHFTGAPWPAEVEVTLDSLEPAVRTVDAAGARHADGSYRFIAVRPGARQVTVRAANAFSWTATTPVSLPRAPALLTAPLVIELWPAPSATVPAGTLAIRGRLVTAAAGQEVDIEVVGAPPRNRRTRCDAQGEFVFVVVGQMPLTTDQKVALAVTVPGRTLTSIQLVDGDTDPVFAGSQVAVPPGRETRARFNLT